jgi:ABC-type multidrug transport system ATPase subunit
MTDTQTGAATAQERPTERDDQRPDDRTADGAPAAEPVLRVEGVERGFGDLTVVDGVSTRLDRGQVAALVGPNGSGKTTLLRIVAGLLSPDAGEVTVTAGGARAIGYLPQAPRFRDRLTVAETLSFYAALVEGGVGVDEAVTQVGLEAVRDRRIGALSGGMVRLVGLAQALLGDPALLVLDEPTSSLDPAMTEYVYDVIDDLAAERGTTVLLSTHDLAVSRVADRVLLLNRGRLVADDTPESVCGARDAETLTAAFLAEVGRGRTVQSGLAPSTDDAETDEDAAAAARAAAPAPDEDGAGDDGRGGDG